MYRIEKRESINDIYIDMVVETDDRDFALIVFGNLYPVKEEVQFTTRNTIADWIQT